MKKYRNGFEDPEVRAKAHATRKQRGHMGKRAKEFMDVPGVWQGQVQDTLGYPISTERERKALVQLSIERMRGLLDLTFDEMRKILIGDCGDPRTLDARVRFLTKVMDKILPDIQSKGEITGGGSQTVVVFGRPMERLMKAGVQFADIEETHGQQDHVQPESERPASS